MMITYACYTHPGGRPINEDTIAVETGADKSCFIVCDGLGGHGMGDEASQFVKDCFLRAFQQAQKTDDDFIRQCFAEAQDALSRVQKERKLQDKMKTTAVLMTVQGKKAHVGYIGDSRFYAFGKKRVKCHSEDHSIPYRLYLSGQIGFEQIRNHPDRNMLMRVMGTKWDDPMYQLLRPMPLWKYRAFLLCTDGFWELITEQTMCRLLQASSSAEQWLETMVQQVRKNGEGKEMDNCSAVAIFCK